MAEDEYLLSRVDLGVEIDAELERLRLLEQALDPLSRRNLTETGLAEGWRCVEIGAGGGSILRWLQDRVGATGHVTAVDIRTTYVDDLAAHPTVTIVCADVREFEFPDGLDLVHERLTVGWIPEGAEVRKRAIDALRPGGWYVSEAAGAARRRDPVVPEYPGATEFEALGDRMNDMLTNTLGADAYAGRAQGAALAEAGLVDVVCEGFEPVFAGGSPTAELWKRTTRVVLNVMIGQGRATEAEAAWFLSKLDDPEFYTTGQTQFATRGRKPQMSNTPERHLST